MAGAKCKDSNVMFDFRAAQCSVFGGVPLGAVGIKGQSFTDKGLEKNVALDAIKGGDRSQPSCCAAATGGRNGRNYRMDSCGVYGEVLRGWDNVGFYALHKSNISPWRNTYSR